MFPSSRSRAVPMLTQWDTVCAVSRAFQALSDNGGKKLPRCAQRYSERSELRRQPLKPVSVFL